MKKYIFRLLFVCAFFVSQNAIAQQTFNSKKRQGNSKINKKNIKGIQFINTKNKGKTSQKLSNKSLANFKSLSFSKKYNHGKVVRNNSGNPIFISSTITKKAKKGHNKKSIETIGKEYLNDIHGLLHIEKASVEFELKSNQKDNLGKTHLKYQQVYKGVKVFGRQVVLHLNSSNEVTVFNGQNISTPTLNVTPKVSFENTIKIVDNELNVSKGKPFTKNKSLLVDETSAELVIYPFNGKNYLTWHITSHPNIKDRWEYFVDAHTAEVVDKFYHTCTLIHHKFEDEHEEKAILVSGESGTGVDLNGVQRTVNSYNTNGKNYLIDTSKPMFDAAKSQMPDNPVGALLVLDLQNQALKEDTKIYHVTSNSSNFNNPIAVSAHYNANVCYEYFKNTFKRNAIDGNGGTVISIINVADENGNGLDNAYWNGKAMFYGNGNVALKPIAGSLDVGGHEMSHGVIQNTADLIYQNQSGAMNESFADIFGTMIDRDDWKLAEDIVNTNYFPSGAMRDMSDPHNGGGDRTTNNGWQPAHMSEMYTGTQDNGGVHINSGILNKAYYLYATAIGKDQAEQIYYRALTNYLTASSQFIDLRLSVIQSAKDLHGDGSSQVEEAKKAFNAVGINDGNPTDTDNDLPTKTGDEYILVHSSSADDDNSLYITDENAQDFTPISKTKLYRKPSIADDGSIAIYVTEDYTVHGIYLNPDNPDEQVLSSDAAWAAVSLSKDSKKMAAVPNDQSNSVYIFDLEKNTFKEFQLYNPTTADGITTGDVQYADALEWDYSGEYLIYDAYNSLNNAEGSNIDYWDVGIMRVWNNKTNDYGDGKIAKLFSNLPEGVSIGNPSLSKTSGNVLAFDYLDANDNSYAVIAANIETGDVKTVFENNTLGFPNYSKNDDKLIFDSENNGKNIVALIGMGGDKISSTGSAKELIIGGKWATWYSTGKRNDDGGDDTTNIPADNFAITSTTESCPSSKNASIQISAKQSRNYSVAFSGNGESANQTFTDAIKFESLTGGTYKICITVADLPDYQQCFDVVLPSTQTLGVTSKVNSKNKELTLNLSGADEYFVTINDETFATTEQTLTLPLTEKNNKVSVKTKKDCQGTFNKNFNLGNEFFVHPNPLNGKYLNVQLLEKPSKIHLQLHTVTGQLILEKEVFNPTKNQVKLNTSSIAGGVYFLSVKTKNQSKTVKILKQ